VCNAKVKRLVLSVRYERIFIRTSICGHIFPPEFSGMLAGMLTENTRMVMFTSLVILLGIICVVANIDSYSENESMIPIVINTWPFTNATQSGKNSHVTIEIGGECRCDYSVRRVCNGFHC
jgi:hypothetical protein